MVFVCLKKGQNFEKSTKKLWNPEAPTILETECMKIYFFALFYKRSMKIELSQKSFLKKIAAIYYFAVALQVSVTHDDVFGDYKCEAHNKMGRISRLVKLSEGAKAGIPLMEINKINTESAIMTILVRIIRYFFSSN